MRNAESPGETSGGRTRAAAVAVEAAEAVVAVAAAVAAAAAAVGSVGLEFVVPIVNKLT
jgi:hypothetical protein